MQEKKKILSISNFNPAAAFALIIAVIGLILAIVATSLDSWARQEVLRQSQNSDDSHTLKTQGLATRCITYVLSDEVLALQLPIEDLPQSQCIGMSGLNCSGASSVLLSAHDVLSHEEIQNSNSMVRCNSMKSDLDVTLAFMILGILATFAAVVLFVPFWHRIIYIFGSCLVFASVVFFAVSIGVFATIEQDYAGYFSVNGVAEDGCLSYGFGVAVAAFMVNIIGTVVGVGSIFFRDIREHLSKKTD